MGNFYVNYTTRGPGREAVAACLRGAQRSAFVGPTREGCTVFFDEESDTQDDEVIKELGTLLSRELKAPVLAVLNHDDDVLAYWLFEAGRLSDEYNSCPGYFDGDDETPAGGDALKLCAAFGVPAQAQQVDAILRNEDYTFALDRHEALAALLKLPWPLCSMGYGYLAEGERPEDLDEGDLLEIEGAG